MAREHAVESVLDTLVQEFPDVGPGLLADVLRETGDDVILARQRLGLMGIFAPDDAEDTDAGAANDQSTLQHNERDGTRLTPSEPCKISHDTNTSMADTTALDTDFFADEFRRLDDEQSALEARRLQEEEKKAQMAVEQAEMAKRAREIAAGRWMKPVRSGTDNPYRTQASSAKLTYAGQMCVQRLLSKYCWAERDVVVKLYLQCGESERLTEELLVQNHPEVLQVAHNPGADKGDVRVDGNAVVQDVNDSRRGKGGRRGNRGRGRNGGQGRPEKTISAKAVRIRDLDVQEIRIARESTVETTKADVARARDRLANLTRARDNAQRLFNSTRQGRYENQVRKYNEQSKQAWNHLRHTICSTADFRNGTVDLHGLTSDQAIEIVDAKLAVTAVGKVHFVTGRGNNSAHRRAVLRPAVMEHLKYLGLTPHTEQDGGVVVVRLRTE